MIDTCRNRKALYPAIFKRTVTNCKKPIRQLCYIQKITILECAFTYFPKAGRQLSRSQMPAIPERVLTDPNQIIRQFCPRQSLAAIKSAFPNL